MSAGRGSRMTLHDVEHWSDYSLHVGREGRVTTEDNLIRHDVKPHACGAQVLECSKRDAAGQGPQTSLSGIPKGPGGWQSQQ